MTARQDLAAAQEELVRALLAGGAAPPGFDAGRIQDQAHALLLKRRRGIERAAPEVPAALGEAFPTTFAEWASAHPPRTNSCSRTDAAAFAAWALPVRTSRRWWTPARKAAARSARP
ncbi:hypothetical protein [Sporichthya sp.]|uniref:hypothetical protein n=1 Tax=Sporichthya sp. TaxID=65475 RepID=UPI0017DB0365|nr:hypothetical protein [Sporichthya sp.]MBA3744999.1 hypothetical protein [Sporichthya sp.]